MINHYDAFISYRHSDQDIRVAGSIQSDLEHFYIPAKIRKATGKKRIDRIFLDKDELGAASNLSYDISEALDNSDHLIVICSTATKESSWVTREIEYFLRNHSRREITTVLVNGEPEDVIPDILKYEDRIITSPDGSTHTVRIPQEPLSCDYRLSRRKAKKEELPRLASKLLKCSYDELMNRRRAFMIRRMAIIVSLIVAAILSFDAYLLYNHFLIKKTLESSLRNQSIYLANESLDSLENDQRILALQLALEAVPKDSDDSRPVTPQAIRALTDSTFSYTTRDIFSIQDLWSYSMPEAMNDNGFRLSPSGKKLASWDKSGNIRVWNTETHGVLLSLTKSNDLHGVTFMPDDNLLVLSSDQITAYRIPDGTCLWEKLNSLHNFSSADNAYFSDNTLLFITNDLKLMRVDPKDGSEIALYELQNDLNAPIMSVSSLQISPDNKRIAFILYNDVASSLILIYDIQSRTTHMIDPEEYINNFIWGDDDHLIMACPEDFTSSKTPKTDSTLAKTNHVKILCYDPKKETLIWRHDFTSTNKAIRSGFLALPEINAVAYYHANKAEIYSIAAGTLISSHNTNDSIIMGQDPYGDGRPLYVTETGGLASPATSDSITIDPYFKGNLDQVFYNTGSGFFTHSSDSSEIIHYGLHVCDEGLIDLKSGTEISAPEKAYMDDRVLAVLSYESPADYPGVVTSTESKELLILTLADPDTGEQLCRIPLAENGESLRIFNISFLGSEGTHFYVGYTTELNGYRVLDIHPGTGEYTGFNLAEKESYIYGDFCTFSNGKFYYCIKNPSGSAILYIYDPDTKNIAEYTVIDQADGASFDNSPIVLPERNSVLLYNTEETLLYDQSNGSAKKLTVPSDWNTVLNTYDAVRDVIALSDKKDIRLISLSEDLDFLINCPSTPLGICFFTDKKNENKTFLLVPSIDGYLYRYNAETGALLGQSDLSVSGTWDEHAEFRFDPENSLMYLQIGDTLDIFETDTWVEETSIQRCLGHHAPSDRFYVYSHPGETIYSMGYFEHYSVDNLIKKAKDMLQDNEMPNEVKAEYGIEITEE